LGETQQQLAIVRVSEEIVAEGNFWLPVNPDHKVTGRLTVKNKAEIRLEIIGGLKSFAEEFSGYHPARILGNVEKHGFVTLDNCAFIKKSFSGQILKSVVSAQFLYLGVAYDEGEEPTFNSFSFDIDGLSEWHGRSGFKVNLDPNAHSVNVAYNMPAHMNLWSDGRMRLKIGFGWSSPAGPTEGKLQIRENSFLRIESDGPRPVSDFAGIAHRIAHLFSLACHQTATISNVRTASDTLKKSGLDGKQYDHIVQVFYPALSFSEPPPKIHRVDLLFRIEDLTPNPQAALSAWFAAHERVTPAMNLYFSAQAGIHEYLDSRFLALVQALETYHRRTSNAKVFAPDEFELLRWAVIENTAPDYRKYIKGRLTHGDEPSLPARITAMLGEFADFFGSEKERKSLVRKVAAARNYYTHFDAALENQVADGLKFWQLSQKMDALMQLLLLKELGFDAGKIHELAAKSEPLKRKLSV